MAVFLVNQVTVISNLSSTYNLDDGGGRMVGGGGEGGKSD